MRKIIKNAIQCKLSGDIIELTDRHEYVKCKCGACAVDGGHDYLHRGYKSKDCYIDLIVVIIKRISRIGSFYIPAKAFRI